MCFGDLCPSPEKSLAPSNFIPRRKKNHRHVWQTSVCRKRQIEYKGKINRKVSEGLYFRGSRKGRLRVTHTTGTCRSWRQKSIFWFWTVHDIVKYIPLLLLKTCTCAWQILLRERRHRKSTSHGHDWVFQVVTVYMAFFCMYACMYINSNNFKLFMQCKQEMFLFLFTTSRQRWETDL